MGSLQHYVQDCPYGMSFTCLCFRAEEDPQVPVPTDADMQALAMDLEESCFWGLGIKYYVLTSTCSPMYA